MIEYLAMMIIVVTMQAEGGYYNKGVAVSTSTMQVEFIDYDTCENALPAVLSLPHTKAVCVTR